MSDSREPFIYFGSSSKLPELSNFYHTSITVTLNTLPDALLRRCPALGNALAHSASESLVFPSSEHLYQGSKARTEATVLRFTVDGDLGSWNPNIFNNTLVPKKVLDLRTRAELAIKKMNFWKKKNCIGILAKLAANPTHGRALGLSASTMAYDLERLSPEAERELWLGLLGLKFASFPLAQKLKETGTKTLIEFDKGAARGAHWGGLWDKETRQVVGDNVMGKYLEEVRERV
jgi:predicted NAD-dependent protein-ADP-ribosyltransferase YbiA (DUF1768 family)